MDKNIEELEQDYEERIRAAYQLGYNESKQAVIRQTAEDIWNQAKFIVAVTKHIVNGCDYLCLDALKELVKQKGVIIND